MAVLMSLGGNTVSGDGFLVVPQGASYEAEIALWTDAGTASVTLQADPMHNAGGLVFSTAGPIGISTVHTVVTVHATLQSDSRGDTTIQVLNGGMVVVSFNVTCIKHPVVNFNGRFEARFATDPARPYTNPMYTEILDTVGPGRTWGLEGEPNFVPITGIVPTDLTMTGVGRVVRLNNPVSLRSHATPVVSTVSSISGETATNSKEIFTTGDPIIGLPVNFGPDTYLAGNNDSSDTPGPLPTPEEFWGAGVEPMALFEFHVGNSFTPPAVYFEGASAVGPFTHKKTLVNDPPTRIPDSRPYAAGIPSATAADYAVFGIDPNQHNVSDARITALIADFNASAPGSQDRRNLNRRIGHLLGSVSAAKFNDVQTHPPGPFTVRTGSFPVDWTGKETYTGKVDADLHAWPGGPPGSPKSGVISYLTEFFAFDFFWNAFAFHTDELCGYHIGTLSGDLSRTGNHIGDPHVHTVDGTAYDFQGVGEFTLLRDGHRMEIQVRQTPVPCANPVTDGYSGLTACVSINTAVAISMGPHRIAIQQAREGELLQFYVDGKPANLPVEQGIDLGASRVTAFAASGETGIRIDLGDGTVILVTPNYWPANKVTHLDVNVSHTRADEGIMGIIPKDSWLPRLRNGVDVGPMPASLHDRYVTLYKTFADSWRVTDKTSLFVYAPGTSTKTFTDHDWPAEHPPCKLKPEFQIPGVGVHKGMPIERAELICRVVTDKNLHKNCVFDVATTGDETFAKHYVLAQELRLYGTSVQVSCQPASRFRNRSAGPAGTVPPPQEIASVLLVATVRSLMAGRPIPTGSVTFFIDGVPMNRPVPLNDRGRAIITITVKPGTHTFRATYSGGGNFDYHSSSSANQICTVGSAGDVEPASVDQGVPHPMRQ
jgi:hypothetical protein